jgi:hypothetical protein
MYVHHHAFQFSTPLSKIRRWSFFAMKAPLWRYIVAEAWGASSMVSM